MGNWELNQGFAIAKYIYWLSWGVAVHSLSRSFIQILIEHQVYTRHCAKPEQLWIRQLEHSPSLDLDVRGGDRHKQVVNDKKQNARE